MEYVGIILTADNRFYIAPPWTVRKGDMILVTNQCGEQVVKTVEDVITEEYNGEAMSFLERFTGCDLKRVDARYTKHDVQWPDEKEAQDVQE